MTLYEYTALKNPKGASEVLANNKIRPHRHPKVLGKQLAQLVRANGETALMQIADVHPDLPLFQAKIDECKAKCKTDIDLHYNNGFSNADGQAIKSEIANLQGEVRAPKDGGDKSKDLLIMGGVILLGLALILKK